MANLRFSGLRSYERVGQITRDDGSASCFRAAHQGPETASVAEREGGGRLGELWGWTLHRGGGRAPAAPEETPG